MDSNRHGEENVELNTHDAQHGGIELPSGLKGGNPLSALKMGGKRRRSSRKSRKSRRKGGKKGCKKTRKH